jgi:hypothetical protein
MIEILHDSDATIKCYSIVPPALYIDKQGSGFEVRHEQCILSCMHELNDHRLDDDKQKGTNTWLRTCGMRTASPGLKTRASGDARE